MRKTQGVARNLTLSTAVDGQNVFIEAADRMYMQVTNGAMSYTQALREAVVDVARQGLNVIQFGGRRDQLDVALRRTLLTGVSQTVGNMQIARADEMGCDLVQVSAHIGARNTGDGPANHESWQGKVYSRSGTHAKYKPFVATTGYGTGEGLGGWNCRHSFYPYFEGLSAEVYDAATLDDYSSKTVKYNGETLSFYEATQYQRGIERKIRYWKRQAGGLEAAGLDNTFERLKIGEWQEKMRKFIQDTGLVRQREREQVLGINARGLTKKPTVAGNTSLPSGILENPEARAAAKELLAKRTLEEPSITELVTRAVEGAGGKMEGLEFRLKSEDSLTHKIVRNMTEKRISIDEAVKEIKDINRYTGIFDRKFIVEKALEARSLLEKNGFDVIKISNTFGKRGAYQGLHFVFKHSDGRVFELQFHTPESIKIKNEIHKLYEEARISTDKIRKNELTRKMIEKWAGFISPDDWSKITDFM